MADGSIALKVTRADGSLEFDAGTDPYPRLIAQARGALISLGKIAPNRVHSRHVVGLLVDTPPANGKLDLTCTVVAPSDPELGGAILFGGLVMLKKHHPAVFAAAMRRLRDAGLVDTGLLGG